MKCLDLFSGTGSFKKICQQLGWDVYTVDIEFDADYKGDILNFNYKPFHDIDIIWASPPCTEYSKCKTRAPRNLEYADSLVKKTLEIINYCKPKYFFIENPKTGLLKLRPFMQDINYYDVDYCKYSDWGYRKRTRIWTNLTNFTPLICKKDCENMSDEINNRPDNGKRPYNYKGKSRHKNQVVSSKHGTAGILDKHLRYRVPPKLILSLLNHINI